MNKLIKFRSLRSVGICSGPLSEDLRTNEAENTRIFTAANFPIVVSSQLLLSQVSYSVKWSIIR